MLKFQISIVGKNILSDIAICVYSDAFLVSNNTKIKASEWLVHIYYDILCRRNYEIIIHARRKFFYARTK